MFTSPISRCNIALACLESMINAHYDCMHAMYRIAPRSWQCTVRHACIHSMASCIAHLHRALRSPIMHCASTSCIMLSCRAFWCALIYIYALSQLNACFYSEEACTILLYVSKPRAMLCACCRKFLPEKVWLLCLVRFWCDLFAF